MKLCFVALYFCILYLNVDLVHAKKVGFLRDQKSCLVKCMNGGICVFNIDHPNEHECRCFEGVYDGRFCENAVTSPAPTRVIHITPNPRDAYTRKQVVDERQFVAETDEYTSETTREQLPLETEAELDEFEHSEEDQREVQLDESEDSRMGDNYQNDQEERENSVESGEQEDEKADYNGNEAEQEEPMPSELDSPGHYIEPATEVNVNRQNSKTTHSVENDYSSDSGSWAMDAKKGSSASMVSLNSAVLMLMLFLRFILL